MMVTWNTHFLYDEAEGGSLTMLIEWQLEWMRLKHRIQNAWRNKKLISNDKEHTYIYTQIILSNTDWESERKKDRSKT